jgi:ATP-binding protein involved in chromosome partitioning
MPDQDGASNTIKPALVGDMRFMSVGFFPSTDQVNILRGPMTANLVRQFLTQVEWGELDYLIIDFPPGTGDIQLTIAQSIPITGAVIVTTPQEVSLADVRKSVRFFQKLSVPLLGVVENMSYFMCDGCEKKHRLFPGEGGTQLAREFALPLLGQIPMEPILAQAGDQGEPLVFGANTDELSAMAFQAAAKEIARQVSIQNSQRQGLEQFEILWQADPKASASHVVERGLNL